MNHSASVLACLTKEQRTSLFFWIGMVVIAGVSIYKAFFGFGGYDESFYLAVGDRIAKGEALFRDEWNLAQLIALFVAPIVLAYKKTVGSYEGIILAVRILYVALHSLTCILAYNKLKRYGCMAVAGVLSLFLFTPFNIMSICYNTMAIDFLVISSLLLATSENGKTGVFVSGMFFACGVMCCPYLALAYAAYLLAALAARMAGKTRNEGVRRIFGAGALLHFTLGISAVAILVLLFVLKGTSLDGLLEEIPLMLGDPEHAPEGIWDKTKLYFESICMSSKFFRIPLSAFGIMVAAMAIDRTRAKHRALYLSATGAITLLAYLSYAPQATSVTYNHIMFPMVFMGIASYCLLDDKPKELFCTTFLAGIAFGFCASMGSNQSFYVISAASVVANLASFVFVGKLLEEIKACPEEIVFGRKFRHWAFFLAYASVAVLFMLQFVSKLNHCFWDKPRPLLDATIVKGPGAGIATTRENADTYQSLYDDISSDPSISGEKLLVLSEKTYLYLMVDDFEYGTLSPWLGGGETKAALDRLDLYYRVHPEKVPTRIYIPKAANWDFGALVSKFGDMGYSVQENGMAYRLQKLPSRD